jgi:type I restriction enzyme M protein
MKDALDALSEEVLDRYGKLTEAQIKTVVVEDKWLTSLRAAVDGEIQRLTQRLAARVKQLEERYAQPLPALERAVESFGADVNRHLMNIGLRSND